MCPARTFLRRLATQQPMVIAWPRCRYKEGGRGRGVWPTRTSWLGLFRGVVTSASSPALTPLPMSILAAQHPSERPSIHKRFCRFNLKLHSIKQSWPGNVCGGRAGVEGNVISGLRRRRRRSNRSTHCFIPLRWQIDFCITKKYTSLTVIQSRSGNVKPKSTRVSRPWTPATHSPFFLKIRNHSTYKGEIIKMFHLESFL